MADACAFLTEFDILLIEPFGIEITINTMYCVWIILLLIEPFGIEMAQRVDGINVLVFF